MIGIEVFGRKPDYNPKQDAIVRTEAGRLRARISEYYTDEGKADPLILEVPKGGYVPVLSRADKVAGDRVKIAWKFDRKTARRKFGYKRKYFTRSET